jgi:hypothetical protein
LAAELDLATIDLLHLGRGATLGSTMVVHGKLWSWPPSARALRFVAYFLILAGVAAWKFVPRSWTPSLNVQTAHYVIASTATREQTDAIGRVVEQLYAAYSNRFGIFPQFRRAHPRLQLKLYRDRQEFRRINPGLGWAEAFYRRPSCQAYYSAQEVNPYHWMLHEAVHQLNAEVTQLQLAQWLDEGLSEYFSTSRLTPARLAVGQTDPDTYPVWWIDQLATTPDLAFNIRNGSVIPLRTLVSGSGGPSMNRHFNLYYLHWWTLAHFLFESPRYREGVLRLIERGGGLEAFTECIGPIDAVQAEWHAHVRRLKGALAPGTGA